MDFPYMVYCSVLWRKPGKILTGVCLFRGGRKRNVSYKKKWRLKFSFSSFAKFAISAKKKKKKKKKKRALSFLIDVWSLCYQWYRGTFLFLAMLFALL